jgi:SAM-dependent methyltransferase
MSDPDDVAGADELPEHVQRNRKAWDIWADEYAGPGERSWATNEFTWGEWGVPESELDVLPDVNGLDVIELGCGTGYISAWLARLGARPVGIDNSPRQLETARRLQDEHDLHFPLMLGNAESVPLPDASFDLAISEYGAAIWADPYRWIPEASRLLRPGGWLIFLANAGLFLLCAPDEEKPAGDRLLRPYFGMHRLEWADNDGAVEFHIEVGEMIRLLRASDFEVVDFIELRPPADSSATHPYSSLEWARQWPTEEIWKARKRG